MLLIPEYRGVGGGSGCDAARSWGQRGGAVGGSPRRIVFADVAKAKVQIEFTKHEES